MDESYVPRRKKTSKARERYVNRQRKRDPMATPGVYFASDNPMEAYGPLVIWRNRLTLILRDAAWYVTHTPVILIGIAGVAALLFLIFVGTHLIQGRIFPNVWSMGVYLGDKTMEEAQAALTNAWDNEIEIQLVDEDRTWTATPAELGLRLDPQPIIETAKNVGMASLPMGWGIDPVVEIDYITAQNFMLDLSGGVEIPPYNAGYQLQGDQVVGVAGRMGRMMDVALTMEALTQNIISIIQNRRLDLIMTPLSPDIIDPEPYLEQAQELARQPLQMVGYDPFINESLTWATTPETFVSWLEADSDGLTLREDAFAPFLDAQNASLNTDGTSVRYLEAAETIAKLSEAINTEVVSVNLRIRYRPVEYEVVRGDTAYGIARKTGLPYFLVQEANTGRDLDTLSVGDKLNLPSRDVAIPLDPVPNKRIVVDLDRQYLKAYENGQEIFSWVISSGRDTAPTTPGIFQILTHNETALGSSYTLCGTQGCGQWKMYWFMGVYEAVPGLMNGFHGAVLLPNGSYLGGGDVGTPTTFGCIMSLDANAKMLYDWAEEGTIVEIISSEFPPQSEIARAAFGDGSSA